VQAAKRLLERCSGCDVVQLTVIEEAIRYIDRLHDMLDTRLHHSHGQHTQHQQGTHSLAVCLSVCPVVAVDTFTRLTVNTCVRVEISLSCVVIVVVRCVVDLASMLHTESQSFFS